MVSLCSDRTWNTAFSGRLAPGHYKQFPNSHWVTKAYWDIEYALISSYSGLIVYYIIFFYWKKTQVNSDVLKQVANIFSVYSSYFVKHNIPNTSIHLKKSLSVCIDRIKWSTIFRQA